MPKPYGFHGGQDRRRLGPDLYPSPGIQGVPSKCSHRQMGAPGLVGTTYVTMIFDSARIQCVNGKLDRSEYGGVE